MGTVPGAEDWTRPVLGVGLQRKPGFPSAADNRESPKTSSLGRDMFGGHGMYSQMWPIGYSMAAIGILPVACSPGELS